MKKTKKIIKNALKTAKEHPDHYTMEELAYLRLVKKARKLAKQVKQDEQS